MSYGRKTSIEERIKDCIVKRDSLNSRIARLEEIKGVWDNLPFKEGDVAFHKQFGNVLIKSIDYGSSEEDLEKVEYRVYTTNHAVQTISYKDLIPISEATTLLYGKSK